MAAELTTVNEGPSTAGESLSDSDLEDVPLTFPSARSNREMPVTPFSTFVQKSSPLKTTLALAAPRIIPTEADMQRTGSSPPNIPPQTPRFHMTVSAPIPNLERPLATSRSIKPPKLLLPNPATASPVSSPASNNVTLTSDNARPERMTLHLLSSAFSLNVASLKNHQNGNEMLKDLVSSRCASGLGVSTEDLRYYELREIQVDEINLGCQQIGVMVNSSSFSLAALEDVLVQNKHLLAAAEKNAQILESLHKEYKESTHCVSRLSTRAAELDVEKKLLQQKCKVLEEENERLRQQLQHSNDHRHKLYKTLSCLRKEFEDLRAKCDKGHVIKELSVSMSADIASGAEDFDLQPLAESKGTPSKHVSLPPETEFEQERNFRQFSSPVDAKSLLLLQRLCSEPTIDKLESLLSKLESLELGKS